MPAWSSQDQVTLTVHVHEGSLDGPALSDVHITGVDGDGKSFEAVTDSGGIAEISGVPGTWQFAFEKDGYETLYLKYDALQSEETAAYLEKAAMSSQDQVTLTVHVHEGSLDGPALSDVHITGVDGDGKSFEAVTDSGGIAEISGVPGTWQFAFEKDGYETLYLKYDALQSEETAAYLESAA
ncbi:MULTISPECIES: hypothetical protein [Methanothrix]|uniref:hypothetical protein n=1 Tax=Methanothrix TaxID=2222 RepID=UPI001E4F2BCF|nr:MULTISPECIES: hypothetical protein [Methanothrix]